MAQLRREATLEDVRYKVASIKTLGWAGDAAVRQMMDMVVTRAEIILKRRRWPVVRVEEFFPRADNLLGMNTNHGELIQLRFRPPLGKGEKERLVAAYANACPPNSSSRRAKATTAATAGANSSSSINSNSAVNGNPTTFPSGLTISSISTDAHLNQPRRLPANASAVTVARTVARLYSFEHVMCTMLHEMAHCAVGPHNSAFWKLYHELVAECEALEVEMRWGARVGGGGGGGLGSTTAVGNGGSWGGGAVGGNTYVPRGVGSGGWQQWPSAPPLPTYPPTRPAVAAEGRRSRTPIVFAGMPPPPPPPPQQQPQQRQITAPSATNAATPLGRRLGSGSESQNPPSSSSVAATANVLTLHQQQQVVGFVRPQSVASSASAVATSPAAESARAAALARLSLLRQSAGGNASERGAADPSSSSAPSAGAAASPPTTAAVSAPSPHVGGRVSLLARVLYPINVDDEDEDKKGTDGGEQIGQIGGGHLAIDAIGMGNGAQSSACGRGRSRAPSTPSSLTQGHNSRLPRGYGRCGSCSVGASSAALLSKGTAFVGTGAIAMTQLGSAPISSPFASESHNSAAAAASSLLDTAPVFSDLSSGAAVGEPSDWADDGVENDNSDGEEGDAAGCVDEEGVPTATAPNATASPSGEAKEFGSLSSDEHRRNEALRNNGKPPTIIALDDEDDAALREALLLSLADSVRPATQQRLTKGADIASTGGGTHVKQEEEGTESWPFHRSTQHGGGGDDLPPSNDVLFVSDEALLRRAIQLSLREGRRAKHRSSFSSGCKDGVGDGATEQGLECFGKASEGLRVTTAAGVKRSRSHDMSHQMAKREEGSLPYGADGGHAEPPFFGVEAAWPCTVCTFINDRPFSSQDVCGMCLAPKRGRNASPAVESSAYIFRSGDAPHCTHQWMCHRCTFAANAAMCEVCQGSKIELL